MPISRWSQLGLLAVALFVAGLFSLTAAAGPPSREVHPLPTQAPVQVSVTLNVVEISDVRDKDQEFDVELYLYQTWQNPALAGGEEREIPMAGQWMPNEELIGARAIKRETDGTLEIFEDGTVRHTQHIWATLAVDFDLRSFPFDEHALPIRVESYSYSADELSFVAAEASGASDEPRVAKGWHLEQVQTDVQLQDYPEENTQYSSFVEEVGVSRGSGYYLWKVVLPLVLIISMSWSVFWIEPTQLGPQMGVAVTTMLSVVAFNFAIANTLPKISYVTRMDLFIVMGYMFVFSAFVENLVVHTLCRRDNVEAADRLDRRCRMAFPAVFGAALVAFLAWP